METEPIRIPAPVALADHWRAVPNQLLQAGAAIAQNAAFTAAQRRKLLDHIRSAVQLLTETPGATAIRQAAINLKLAMNVADYYDLEPRQLIERNRIARAFNCIIKLETGIRFQPAPIRN